jgi:hypothetical protein
MMRRRLRENAESWEGLDTCRAEITTEDLGLFDDATFDFVDSSLVLQPIHPSRAQSNNKGRDRRKNFWRRAGLRRQCLDSPLAAISKQYCAVKLR